MRPKRSTAVSALPPPRCEARYVELDDEQVLSLADSIRHCVGVASGRDDCVAGGERCLGDVDAHTSTGAGHEPDLLVSHVLSVLPSAALT